MPKGTPRPLRALQKKQRGSRGTQNHPEGRYWSRRTNRAALVSLSPLQLARELQKQTKEVEGTRGETEASRPLRSRWRDLRGPGGTKNHMQRWGLGRDGHTTKEQKPLGTLEGHQNQINCICKRPGSFFPAGVLYLSFCLHALASRFQMNFMVRKHPGRISFLFALRKRNAPISTQILQWLVSDKTFPNPLIYQMANPVNSLRNIIACNLFCYSFYAYTSLSLAAYQQASQELKHGCSHEVLQQCNFL